MSSALDYYVKTGAKFIYEYITWFIVGILLIDIVVFSIIKGGIILAILNGIVLIVFCIRLWKTRQESG